MMKNIFVYGIGFNCRNFLKYATDIDFRIKGFVDKNTELKSFMGNVVIKPEELSEEGYDEIFVTPTDNESILSWMTTEKGIAVEKIVIPQSINWKYLLKDIDKYRYLMVTTDVDYLNISYKGLLNDGRVKVTTLLNPFEYQEANYYKGVIIIRSQSLYYLWTSIDNLRKAFPCATFLLLLSDMLDGEYGILNRMNIPRFSLIADKFDMIVTYHEDEAIKYEIECYSLPYTVIAISKNIKVSNDLCFVGNAKNRLIQLYDLYMMAMKKNLICDFWISGVDEAKKIHGSNIHYNQRMTYTEYLKVMSKSRCIVDLCQNGDKTTLRFYEAMAYGKKLITNDTSCVNKAGYDKNYVQTYSKLEELDLDWVLKEEDGKREYHDEYDPVKFLDYLDSLLY